MDISRPVSFSIDSHHDSNCKSLSSSPVSTSGTSTSPAPSTPSNSKHRRTPGRHPRTPKSKSALNTPPSQITPTQCDNQNTHHRPDNLPNSLKSLNTTPSTPSSTVSTSTTSTSPSLSSSSSLSTLSTPSYASAPLRPRGGRSSLIAATGFANLLANAAAEPYRSLDPQISRSLARTFNAVEKKSPSHHLTSLSYNPYNNHRPSKKYFLSRPVSPLIESPPLQTRTLLSDNNTEARLNNNAPFNISQENKLEEGPSLKHTQTSLRSSFTHSHSTQAAIAKDPGQVFKSQQNLTSNRRHSGFLRVSVESGGRVTNRRENDGDEGSPHHGKLYNYNRTSTIKPVSGHEDQIVNNTNGAFSAVTRQVFDCPNNRTSLLSDLPTPTVNDSLPVMPTSDFAKVKTPLAVDIEPRTSFGNTNRSSSTSNGNSNSNKTSLPLKSGVIDGHQVTHNGFETRNMSAFSNILALLSVDAAESGLPMNQILQVADNLAIETAEDMNRLVRYKRSCHIQVRSLSRNHLHTKPL